MSLNSVVKLLRTSMLAKWNPETARGKRVLVVFAHPDDVDFYFGGTVALLVAAGAYVTYLCVTRGDKGDRSGERTGAETASVRELEQLKAAQTLGVLKNKVKFLDEKDGFVVKTPELVRAIALAIREARADIVVTLSAEMFDPSWGFNHPDHRAVAEATVHAIYPNARNGNFYQDSELPKQVVTEVLMLSHDAPNVRVVTSGRAFANQMLALKCHYSQWGDAEPVCDKRRKLGSVETYRLVTLGQPMVVPKK